MVSDVACGEGVVLSMTRAVLVSRRAVHCRAVPRPPGRSVRAPCTCCVLERVPLHRG